MILFMLLPVYFYKNIFCRLIASLAAIPAIFDLFFYGYVNITPALIFCLVCTGIFLDKKSDKY